MAVPDTPARTDAVEMGSAIRSGHLTASEAVAATLSEIDRQEPDLHAFITVDAKGARETAIRLDRLAAEGTFAGPLHGVPVSVKDLLPTAGLRTTFGSALHTATVPNFDDLAVARLRAAGAVIVGKTNTPEFGFGALCKNAVAGNTANPFAPERSSGGSSGGSAVAVATGMSALSLGTDFGGSVRTPAAFCNVVGLRPTAGLIPRVPKKLPWDALPSHGILARSVADARLMLSVLAGADPRDPVSSVHSPPAPSGPLRFAATPDLGICAIDHAVVAAFEAAVQRIEALAPVTRATPDMQGSHKAFETIRGANLFFEFGRTLDENPETLSETARWNIERGRGISASELLAAEQMRGEIRLRCLKFFEDHDILLLPAASVPPFPLEQENVDSINGQPTRNIIDYLTITYAISLIGFPAISVPAGRSEGGLPFGLQMVAAPGQDQLLMDAAAQVEALQGHGHSFPGT